LPRNLLSTEEALASPTTTTRCVELLLLWEKVGS
jgi:hypothetical protein